MRDAAKLRGRLTYSNVMSTIAVFMVLGGGAAVAANQLPKNSVGSPQIRKNAVKTGDIARNAVRVGKIDKEAVKAGKLAKNAVPTNRLRDNAVTGDKVNESTLSIVPSAQTSNSIVPPEGWHEVGAPGEVGFQNGWANVPGPVETAAFYKDHEGVVHLKGVVTGGTGPIFQLPSGYRPANGRLIFMPVFCGGGGCPANVGIAEIVGSGIAPESDGGVAASGESVSLNGIDFRAES